MIAPHAIRQLVIASTTMNRAILRQVKFSNMLEPRNLGAYNHQRSAWFPMTVASCLPVARQDLRRRRNGGKRRPPHGESPAVSRADLIQTYISAKTAANIAPTPPAELQAEAEQAVAEAVAKIEAMRLNGDLKVLNTKYKIYRQTQMRRGEKAIPYSVFLERRAATIVRQVAASGRMV